MSQNIFGVADQLMIPANDFIIQLFRASGRKVVEHPEVRLRLKNPAHLIGMKVQKQLLQNHSHCKNTCRDMFSSSALSGEALRYISLWADTIAEMKDCMTFSIN